jgi:hypothetical protein
MRRPLKIAIIVLAAAIAVTPLPRGLVERLYARGWYAFLQPRVTPISNATSFAWFDAVVLAIAGVVVVMWTVRLRRAGRAGALMTLAGLVLDSAALAAVVYLWFLAAWGLNYQREPLRAQLDFREERITRDALRALAGRNVESLNRLYTEAHRSPWPELPAVADELGLAFARAQQDLGMTWRAAAGRPKRTLLNFYFTRVSIDGMTDPFFLETLTNQSLLAVERASTVAHEWGHLAGYADESEASFVGWLVCMRGSPPTQYSGWLGLYETVMNALPPEDRERIARSLDAGPREDLRAIAERVRRQALPMASRAGYALYDRFLKANRVEAGIRSYGEVVRLLLGTNFTEDGAPILRPKT